MKRLSCDARLAAQAFRDRASISGREAESFELAVEQAPGPTFAVADRSDLAAPGRPRDA